jgi:hypothetical protein
MNLKNIYHQKKFIFKEDIDFNTISKILDSNEYDSYLSSFWLNFKVLSSTFQIKKTQNYPFINNIFNILNKEFNPKNLKSDMDIFFSFQTGARSIIHTDNYDVYIVGCYGRTLYKIGNEEFIVSPGDLLYIPNNIRHVAIGLDPRIILSFGIDEKP